MADTKQNKLSNEDSTHKKMNEQMKIINIKHKLQVKYKFS